MNTNSTYTITNEMKGTPIREGITFEEAKKFVFAKMSKNNFNPTCLADYRITDTVTGEYLPLQYVKF